LCRVSAVPVLFLLMTNFIYIFTIHFLRATMQTGKSLYNAALETSYKACAELGKLSARCQPTFPQQKKSV